MKKLLKFLILGWWIPNKLFQLIFLLCFLVSSTYAEESFSVSRACKVSDQEGKEALLNYVKIYPPELVDKEIKSYAYPAILKPESFSIEDCSLQSFLSLTSSLYPQASTMGLVVKNLGLLKSLKDKEDIQVDDLGDLYKVLSSFKKIDGSLNEDVHNSAFSQLNALVTSEKYSAIVRYYSFIIISSNLFNLGHCLNLDISQDSVSFLPEAPPIVFVTEVREECLQVFSETSYKFLDSVKDDLEGLSNDKLAEFKLLIKYMYSLMPDSSYKLDIRALMARLGLIYPGLSDLSFNDLGREVISRLGFVDRVRLLLYGRLPLLFYFILLCFLVCPVVVYYLVVTVSKIERKPKESKKIVKAKSKKKVQVLDEYSSLLDFFGLDDNASENDIKRAYRDLARKYHPDSADEEAIAEFKLVQANYDKLVKLRKGWFGLSR